MNKKQLAVMWLGILIIVSMIVFPPVIIQHFFGASVSKFRYLSGSYSPIWGHYNKIDLARISIQILGVALVTGGFIVTFRGKEK